VAHHGDAVGRSGNRFAQLLHRAIAAGIDPDTVTALLTD